MEVLFTEEERQLIRDVSSRLLLGGKATPEEEEKLKELGDRVSKYVEKFESTL